MAIVAVGLLLASIFSLDSEPSATPYDNASIETSVEEAPTESLPSEPHAYLYAAYPRYARRLDCVIGRESRWSPTAYNPRSGASGLAQFIYSTWMSTPQGKAGASRTNAIASIDASVFLIEQTPQSWRHWTTISLC